MSETTLVKTVYFNASPEMVWEFLTDSDRLGQWYFGDMRRAVVG